MFASAYGAAAVLAVITTLLVIACSGGRGDIDGPWGDSTLLSFKLGGHYGPAWGRADGHAVIVFRWGDERQYVTGGSLYSIREDGTELTLLSESVGNEYRELSGNRLAFDIEPAVSPDGTRVAYATLRHEAGHHFNIDTATLERREKRLFFFGGGRDERNLTEDVEGSARAPAWSPDGTRIAFLLNREVHTMAADGSDVRSIAAGVKAQWEPPAWSPDGTRLAFREYIFRDFPGESSALYVVGTDGSGLTRIAESGSLPLWSPDGRRLAIMARSEAADVPGPRVDLIEADGSGVETLVAGGFVPLWWSPDGMEIVAHGLSGCELYAIEVTGGANREFGNSNIRVPINSLVALPPCPVRGRAVSPDGSRIAVLTHTMPGQDGREEGVVLFTTARDGSDLRVLVRVGPDGELVAEGEAAR